MGTKVVNPGFLLANLALLAVLLAPAAGAGGAIGAAGLRPPEAGTGPRRATALTADTIKAGIEGRPEKAEPTAWPVFYRLPGADKVVALTFDDGPGKLTASLLKVLAEKKVPATFFLVGNAALNNPSLVQAIAREGGQLALHTWSHPYLTREKREKVYWQIEAGAAALAGLGVDYLPLVRPPYGSWDEEVREVCRSLGYSLVLWDVDSRDWEGGPADRVLERVLGALKPGSIVLFHEGKKVTLEVLPRFIDAARDRGYTFVFVGDYIPGLRAGKEEEGQEYSGKSPGGVAVWTLWSMFFSRPCVSVAGPGDGCAWAFAPTA